MQQLARHIRMKTRGASDRWELVVLISDRGSPEWQR
jgi:hypothetical protein